MTDDNPHYADACQSCGRRYVAPEAGVLDGADGLVAGYRCPGCRTTWTCCWAIVPGRTIPPEPATEVDLFARHLAGEIHERAAMNRARKHLAHRRDDD